MYRNRSKERARRIALALAAIFLLAVVLWVEFTTPLWQELVILAGITAGLVTFLLTVLVLDRIIARSTARRWAPITRLALTEFLHALADEERSEISRGVIHPRELTISASLSDPDLPASLHRLREIVVAERKQLTAVLGTWSNFLASTSDHEELLVHVAEIALRLDNIRDHSIEVEQGGSEDALASLKDEVAACNINFTRLAEEMQRRISQESRQYEAAYQAAI